LKNSSNNRRIQKTNRFSRDIKKLAVPIQKEAFKISRKLSENLFAPDVNVRKMTGLKNTFRAAVMDDYRLIFSYDSTNLYLLRIGHRKEIYRKLEI
jgi:mRNA-degrading endonuclease RelE of RelBE toxin-antitoxin system